MNRSYELMFIVRPDMVEEELNKLISTLESSVTTAGGTAKSEVWGKRRLAYRVGKFNDGIFVLMLIEATGAVVHEVERRLGGLLRGERVDHDPALGAGNEGYVRNVHASHLVDARRDLEQSGHVIESGLSPKTGIDRRGRIERHGRVIKECVTVEVPHAVREATGHLTRRPLGDATTLDEIEVLGSARVNELAHRGLSDVRVRTGWFSVRCPCWHDRPLSDEAKVTRTRRDQLLLLAPEREDPDPVAPK